MILLTEKRLKFIENMGMSRQFHTTVVGKDGQLACLLNSKPELAEAMERDALRSGADFAVSNKVHCEWDEHGKFAEPPMFVAFEHDTMEFVSIHDQTALMLFVASLAMESPNFKEDLKLSKEDNDLFSQYWDLVDEMIDDPGSGAGLTRMTLDRFGYKFTIWRCFVNDSWRRRINPESFEPLQERFTSPTFD